MRWLFGGKRLRELGILGMNRRNATCILERNPRALFPLVDDKLKMRELCERIGVPTPEIYRVFQFHGELHELNLSLQWLDDFVIKPCNGSAGRGVLVITGRDTDAFVRSNGSRIGVAEIRQHLCSTLAGAYSLGGRPDCAIVQQRVRLHTAFQRISYRGIPDIRVILYRGEPAMAMLRLPTLESTGRANLHQGGIGAGIDLAFGETHHAIHRGRAITRHPDTGESLIHREVPNWRDVLAMSKKVARAIGLGYVGVDIVIDEEQGPMLLEANARPGLAIQIANDEGLLPRLREIDAQLNRASTNEPTTVPRETCELASAPAAVR